MQRADDVQVLREDDPRAAALADAGWTVQHRSWGARLEAPDPEALAALVARVVAQRYRVAELGAEADGDVVALEAANRGDYPGGPATAPAVRTTAGLAADRAGGTRWFGASADGRVVAVLHDLGHAARYADHVIAMKDGVVVAAGPPAEVITAPLVESVFGLPCVVIDDPLTGTPLVIARPRA